MYFLFSGEGPTDFGTGRFPSQVCEGGNYEHGPMALIVDQIVCAERQYRPTDSGCCGFVSKGSLSETARTLRHAKKGVHFPGSKRPQETAYFFRNARALAKLATAKARDCGDDVVAILFRDCDGSHSAGRGLWKDKQKSMVDGFDAESFQRGVPMLPKPTSEAWLICALKSDPYRNCDALEARSPSRRAQAPLKDELREILGGNSSRETLCALFNDNRVDALRIDMPSFDAFRDRLQKVI